MNTTLSNKADINHTHTLSDITDYDTVDINQYYSKKGLNSALSGKAIINHAHTASDLILKKRKTENK